MSDLRATAASLIARRNGGAGAPSNDGTRYSDRQVSFEHEFTLGGSQEVYPPGSYTVETAEEIHELNGRSAYVRKACLLIVPTASGTRSVQVNSDELDNALTSDFAARNLGAPNENPDKGRAERPAPSGPDVAFQSALDRYGIGLARADVFVWRGYRYTNASDAIAAAIRADEQ